MVEFAIVLPLLLLLIYGIISFGAQFLVLQTIKQAASDGARAAIAGTTPTEEQALASTTATADLSYLNQSDLSVTPTIYAAGSSECGSSSGEPCIQVSVVYNGPQIVPAFPGLPTLPDSTFTTVLLNQPPPTTTTTVAS